ncbi:MAG: DUF998 domain-containing protein [Candidatus Methanoplasma sp.]|jgi:hypothetical membrane protein|nr:DUF998 domain-containing protein [Candidatus Methanoplasma sp.]
MKNKGKHQIAFAWTGILGALCFLIAWAAAAAADPSWTLGEDWVSDLGTSDASSAYFKAGCAVAGILIVAFGAGNVAYGRNAGHEVGGAILIAAGLAALAIASPIEGDAHAAAAYCLAILLGAAAASIAAGNWAAGRHATAGVAMVMVIGAAAAVAAHPLVLAEPYVLIVAAAWISIEGVRMILDKGKD